MRPVAIDVLSGFFSGTIKDIELFRIGLLRQFSVGTLQPL